MPLLAVEIASSLALLWAYCYSSSSFLTAALCSSSYLLAAARKSPIASGYLISTFFTGRASNLSKVFFGVDLFNFIARFALRRLILTSSFERPQTYCSLVYYSPSISRASPTAVTPIFGANSLLILDWTSKLNSCYLISSSVYSFYLRDYSLFSVFSIKFPMNPFSSGICSSYSDFLASLVFCIDSFSIKLASILASSCISLIIFIAFSYASASFLLCSFRLFSS